MMSELTLIKRRRLLGATVICVVLIAGLTMLGQMGGTAKAAVLTPIESPPETVFYDDFSGDLSQWTVQSGTWAIENGELSAAVEMNTYIFAGDINWSNYVVEAKMMAKGGDSRPMLLGRAQDSSNLYGLHLQTDLDDIRISKKVAGTWILLDVVTITLNYDVWYECKMQFSGSSIKCWLDNDLIFDVYDGTFSAGKIGFRQAPDTTAGHGHFDDVNVGIDPIAGAYNLNVRAGVTQIVVTCSWSGSGNITIANLTSPTTTYYESEMSIYEKTTMSVEGTTSIFNIRRTVLAIAATTSPETWTLYLNLNGVTTYQVSVETS